MTLHTYTQIHTHCDTKMVFRTLHNLSFGYSLFQCSTSYFFFMVRHRVASITVVVVARTITKITDTASTSAAHRNNQHFSI